ncbi:MAG: 16S rRNA processing protein RimM [Lachnospiraceae bacterium]|nr:16S rRNA processing protein RimM [Lachnospiraceae bacterium]
MKEMIFQVGVITSPHGVAGEVKIFPTNDDPAHYKKFKKVLAKPLRGEKATVEYESNAYVELHIRQVKFFKNMVIVKFEEIASMNDAELNRGRELYITRDQAVPCKKNENFIADLIDMEVYNEDGKLLGICKDVLQTGANDVYVVELADGKELLLPAIRECILDVSVDENRMTVHVLEGLM